MPVDTFTIKLQLLCEEALSPNCVGRAGRHRVFPQIPNAARFDEAIRDQAKYSKKIEEASVPLQFLWKRDDIKKMESIITLKHFSPQAKQQTTLVRRLLDEYQAKKRNNNNQLSQIEEIEHLQMIYRASGAAMRYIRQVGALADGYLFPVLRAVHWTASDKMEQLLPNRIAASPKANSHLYFSRPAQLGGRDVGEIVMSHTGLTGHGHETDQATENVYLSEQEAWSWKISIYDGKLHALNNHLLLDTSGANAHAADKLNGPVLKIDGNEICNNSYGYVMSTQGHLFAGEQTGGSQATVNIGIKTHRKPLYHSSCLGGNDIRCGGRIFVQDGVLKGIDNNSGHYQPNTNNLRGAILELKRQGVDLKNTYVCDLSPENLERENIEDAMYTYGENPHTPPPWKTVEEFLRQDVNILLPNYLPNLTPKLKTVVDSYRRRSKGIFTRTSKETLTALAVLQGLEDSKEAYFAACCFYAFYKSGRDEENNALKTYADYIARKKHVRLTPLEQVRKRNGEPKSGFRRKLLSILPGPPPNFR